MSQPHDSLAPLKPLKKRSPRDKAAINPNRVGIYADVLLRIIAHLEADPRLQKLFGVPVSRNVVLVADDNDLRLEEGGRVVPLSKEQARVFLEVLEEAIQQNAV